MVLNEKNIETQATAARKYLAEEERRFENDFLSGDKDTSGRYDALLRQAASLDKDS